MCRGYRRVYQLPNTEFTAPVKNAIANMITNITKQIMVKQKYDLAKFFLLTFFAPIAMMMRQINPIIGIENKISYPK